MSDIRDVVIIGSGPAGYTAAIYAARADLKPLMIAGVSKGGQLMITSDVENYPGFEQPILGPELMERMEKQCLRLGVDIVPEFVSKVSFHHRPFTLETTEGKVFKARSVILATGAAAKWLDIPAEKRLQGKGLSACATCDGFFFKGKNVLVVGGGDTAMEEATFLTKFASKVTVVHRRDSLRASKIMQDRARANPKIEFIWDSVVTDLLGKESVEGAVLKNLKTGKSSTLACDGLFVAIGHQPNTAVFKGHIELTEHGYAKVDARTRTSVPGVFAAGDVADSMYRQAVTAAGLGCMAALEAERFLAHEPTTVDTARR
jgi:thioredoxin reductase (NADPH)